MWTLRWFWKEWVGWGLGVHVAWESAFSQVQRIKSTEVEEHGVPKDLQIVLWVWHAGDTDCLVWAIMGIKFLLGGTKMNQLSHSYINSYTWDRYILNVYYVPDVTIEHRVRHGPDSFTYCWEIQGHRSFGCCLGAGGSKLHVLTSYQYWQESYFGVFCHIFIIT